VCVVGEMVHLSVQPMIDGPAIAMYLTAAARALNQRELPSIHRPAWAATRDAKPDGPFDFGAAARLLGAKWARQVGTPLASLASRVTDIVRPRRA
jgi:hypothetical protein